MQGRIGVFGGTFDPPHVGHVAAAAQVRHSLGLDAVLLVVANDPWQKSASAPLTEATIRLAMVEAAVEGVEGLAASDVEIRRGGPSYSVDTLRELRAQGAEALHLIVGRDAAVGIETWHEHEAIRSLAVPVVVDRPGEVGPLPTGWPWRHVEVVALPVSSSALRARVAAGEPVDGLVPAGAVAVLRAHRLYRDAP